MKYCPKCGTENEDTAKFCIKCGTAFEEPVDAISSQKEVDSNFTASRTETQNTNNFSLVELVGIAIIAIFILLGLGFGGHHLYLNHRSEQRTADIGQTIANKDFGKGEVQVYYSKKKNAFTVKPISTTKASIKEYGYDDDNQEEIDTINSNYKNFIKDINKHMGSNYKDYRSFLTNPWNSNRYFIASTGTKETYNILHD